MHFLLLWLVKVEGGGLGDSFKPLRVVLGSGVCGEHIGNIY